MEWIQVAGRNGMGLIVSGRLEIAGRDRLCPGGGMTGRDGTGPNGGMKTLMLCAIFHNSKHAPTMPQISSISSAVWLVPPGGAPKFFKTSEFYH
ncbi:unnamed protein product [Allacma fusca]|uniref:Uncharacterized protein n=1 Tax=Allacma fusca TaxID=39272 RepID=A0A8J2L837_9HEXA|nr:unnamed protein product [Allacma fusca]